MFYVKNYPDAGSYDGSPLAHFFEHGAESGAWPNPFFETSWYLAQYAQARVSPLDPLSHFLEDGAGRGFQPNRFFDIVWYQQTYLAADADTNPLVHFIEKGAIHSTCPNRLLDFRLLAKSDPSASRAELQSRYAKDDRNVCAPSLPNPKSNDHNALKLLFIDAIYPRPNVDSGSLDTLNHLKSLIALGISVTFVASAEFYDDQESRRNLESLGVLCVDFYKYSSVEDFIAKHCRDFVAFVLCRVYAGGNYFERVRNIAPQAAIVFNPVDLHHLREQRESTLTGCASQSEWTRFREVYLARRCEATIVVSSVEATLLQHEEPEAHVELFPLLRDVPGRAENVVRSCIGFVGNFGHRPNVDAMHYFLDQIWPLVIAKMPVAELEIIGEGPPESLRARSTSNVHFLGQVDDLGSVLARWRVSVAPLRYGAGAKGKIVSSLAHGVPCVATPMAVEGMALEAGREIFVVEDAVSFAEAVSALATDEARWNAMSLAGLEAVRRTNDVIKAPGLWADLFRRIGVDLDRTC